MLGLGNIGQFTIGQVGEQTVTETVTADKWFAALSEPPRKARGLRASQQQFAALDNPYPFVSFSWMQSLAEPVRKARRSPAVLAPDFFFQPMPSPFVETGWFTALSEPVRKRRALPPALIPFFSIDPTVITITATMPWFTGLSEPMRFKVGTRPSRQQAYWAPPRLLPNPNLFGVLNALETKDTLLAGAVLFNRPTDAEIGLVNTTPQPAEVGISATGTATGAITVRISIIVG